MINKKNMNGKKIPRSIPVYFDETSKEDTETYNGLRKAAFLDRATSMSDVLKAGARRELKKLGVIKK